MSAIASAGEPTYWWWCHRAITAPSYGYDMGSWIPGLEPCFQVPDWSQWRELPTTTYQYPCPQPDPPMQINVNPVITTDCRSEEGVTIGLVDAIIAVVRILSKRDLSPASVQEALKDLASDEDLATILHAAHQEPQP